MFDEYRYIPDDHPLKAKIRMQDKQLRITTITTGVPKKKKKTSEPSPAT
jgi:hypothetical protein